MGRPMTNKVTIERSGSNYGTGVEYCITIKFDGGEVIGYTDEWYLKKVLGVTQKVEDFKKCERNEEMVTELKLFCYRWGDEFG